MTRRWGLTNSRPTAVHQSEYEWVYLFGAVNPLTGTSSALLAPSVNTEYMNHHLRFISEQAGPTVQVILVLDRAGWHLAKGLQVPENITRLYLPPYSPELNPVERLWAYLRSHYLSNRAYRFYILVALTMLIRHYYSVPSLRCRLESIDSGATVFDLWHSMDTAHELIRIRIRAR